MDTIGDGSTPGLPIGMQFSTGYGEDKTLLELAYELEDQQDPKQVLANDKARRTQQYR